MDVVKEDYTTTIVKDGDLESGIEIAVAASAEGDTVTTAPISSQSFSCSLLSSISKTTSVADAQQRIEYLQEYTGPLIPEWHGVENLVDGVYDDFLLSCASPIYCMTTRKKQKSRLRFVEALALRHINPKEDISCPPTSSAEGCEYTESDTTSVISSVNTQENDEKENDENTAILWETQHHEIGNADSSLSYTSTKPMCGEACMDDARAFDVPLTTGRDCIPLGGSQATNEVTSLEQQGHEEQQQLALLASPRSPISSFGEFVSGQRLLLCRMVLNNTVHLPFAVGAAGLPSSPISTHSSFIFFPSQQSLVIARNWAKRTSQSSPCSLVSKNLLQKRLEAEGLDLEHPPITQSDSKTSSGSLADNKLQVEDDDDEVSTLSTGIWSDSEQSYRKSATTTIFVNPGNAKIVEEGASLFEDDELRAFTVMTKGVDDASELFPSFSQESLLDLESDDGLGDEIVALGTLENELRAELEIADQIITGVLAKNDETSDIFSGCSSFSPLSMDRSSQRFSSMEDSICNLASDEADICNAIHNIPLTPPEDCAGISLRRVRFSQINQEYIFISETPTQSDEGPETFREFLVETCEEIYKSVGDFIDEAGCRPISFSVLSRRPTRCSSKEAKISTVYYC